MKLDQRDVVEKLQFRYRTHVIRRTRRGKFTSSRILPPQLWCEQCVKGRGTENPPRRVTFERAESTLPCHRIRFLFHQDLWNRPRCDRRRRSDVLGVARRGHRVHEGRTSRWKDRDRIPGRKVRNASLSSSFDDEFVYVVMGNPRLWFMQS